MADTRAAGDLADQGVAGGYMVETLGGVGGPHASQRTAFVLTLFAVACVFAA